eukprot:gene19637-26323_t
MKTVFVYVVHMKGLAYRMKRVLCQLSALNKHFNVTVVVSDHFDTKCIHESVNLGEVFCKDQPASSCTLNAVSSVLNHYECIKHISKAADNDVHMVIDDDVFMFPDAPGQIQSACSLECDVALLGLSREMPLTSIEAYILTPSAARRLLGRFMPARVPFNAHLTSLISSLVVASPAMPAFKEGSKTGEDADLQS